jgi:dolichol-phosphate mannosyltransferase
LDLSEILSLGYWRHFIKFNVVGAIGVLVNDGLYYLFLLGGVYDLYADVVAIEISILSNFFLNDFWTFRDRRHGHLAIRLLKFNGLMLIGLVVNLVIYYGLTRYFGIQGLLSNTVGIGFAALLRYWLSIRFAWIKKEEESVVPGPSLVSRPWSNRP